MGRGGEERVELNGWGIGVRESGVGRAGWNREWGEGERRGQGWIKERV